MFWKPFFTMIPYSSLLQKEKKDFKINSTLRSDFLVYLELLNGDKSDFSIFFFGKLTYVLKEEDTNIIRGIPQIYNDNINIKQQMATG